MAKFQQDNPDIGMAGTGFTVPGVAESATTNLIKTGGAVATEAFAGFQRGQEKAEIQGAIDDFFQSKKDDQVLAAAQGDVASRLAGLEDPEVGQGAMLRDQMRFGDEAAFSLGDLEDTHGEGNVPNLQAAKQAEQFKNTLDTLSAAREQGIMSTSELFQRIDSITKSYVDKYPGMTSDFMGVRNNTLSLENQGLSFYQDQEKAQAAERKERKALRDAWGQPDTPEGYATALQLQQRAGNLKVLELFAQEKNKGPEELKLLNTQVEASSGIRQVRRIGMLTNFLQGVPNAPLSQIHSQLDRMKEAEIAAFRSTYPDVDAAIKARSIKQIETFWESNRTDLDGTRLLEINKTRKDLAEQVWFDKAGPEVQSLLMASNLMKLPAAELARMYPGTFADPLRQMHQIIQKHDMQSSSLSATDSKHLTRLLGLENKITLEEKGPGADLEGISELNARADAADFGRHSSWNYSRWGEYVHTITEPSAVQLVKGTDRGGEYSRHLGIFLESKWGKELADDFDPKKTSFTLDNNGLISFTGEDAQTLNSTFANVYNKTIEAMGELGNNPLEQSMNYMRSYKFDIHYTEEQRKLLELTPLVKQPTEATPNNVGSEPQASVRHPAASLVESFEGFSPTAKGEVVDKGKLQIGFGNTQGVKAGDSISREEAERQLDQTLMGIDSTIDKLVTVDLTEEERTAIASLIYNVGEDKFASSKALKALNAGDRETFMIEAFDPVKGFVKAKNDKGEMEVLAGLQNRRRKEAEHIKAGGVQQERLVIVRDDNGQLRLA